MQKLPNGRSYFFICHAERSPEVKRSAYFRAKPGGVEASPYQAIIHKLEIPRFARNDTCVLITPIISQLPRGYLFRHNLIDETGSGFYDIENSVVIFVERR